MKQSKFPKGWDEERVKRVLDHYKNQTEDEAVAEDEAAWEDTSQTFVEVPNELVPAVRELLAKKVACFLLIQEIMKLRAEPVRAPDRCFPALHT